MAKMDIEDRIFELTGHEAIGGKVIDAIVEEYGVDRSVARELYVKVRTERGDPNRVATREAIARLKQISFI
ncbi:MAG TPA: hypothetical protein VEX36_08535 [Thermoleophilaceae bacterium]|nr:hypothetical protein [Thermoleophilaceae bacterium]